jgi:methionine-rich copper-binding protein CopC
LAAEFIYPDDFDAPQWPLEPGKYHVVWRVVDPEGSVGGTGYDFKIRKWQG